MKKNVRIAESIDELKLFLKETVKESQFRLEKIKLSEQTNWSIKNGVLSHFSNGFFQICGVKNKITDEEHLVIYQPQSALTGLALYKVETKVYILLQARVEPGNSNIVQYGPTIQSTPANFHQIHGGKKTSYLELFTSFNPIANPLGNSNQLDLGTSYFQKTKLHSYIELKEIIETEKNMIWAPLNVVVKALSFDNFLNADLRSLISIFDWDVFIKPDIGNNNKPFLVENVQNIFTENHLGKNFWELTAINKLKRWEINDKGIVDISNSGIWVDMFQVFCTNRETSSWSQPLVCCSDRGIIILLARKIETQYEFLVSFESEFGISGEIAILPSFVYNPTRNKSKKPINFGKSKVIAEMIQSEEGGRFYKNESVHQVILIENEISIQPNQKWININTLKSILKSSNRVSFELRCISSLVLDILNPNTF